MKTSPRFYARLGYLVIFLIFGGLGSWAATAVIDSAVVAPGTVALEGDRKVVQHL
ncbi:MAG: secretion protein HlyD, partial [Sphingobium sp.]